MIAQEELRKILSYNKKSGEMTWKENRCWKAMKGDKAGCLNLNGYIHITILGRIYKAHRLVWLYVYGEWPDQIDHINHDRTDNRLKNLRNVTKKENLKNRTMQSNNTSGYNGVTWHRRSGKWRARISVDKTCISIGLFKTKESAIKARKNAENKYGFHGNHGQIKAYV